VIQATSETSTKLATKELRDSFFPKYNSQPSGRALDFNQLPRREGAFFCRIEFKDISAVPQETSGKFRAED
jgi:hypothetical protein